MILNENAMWLYLHFRIKCPILDMAKASSKKPLSQSKIAEFFSHLQWWENNFYQPNGPKAQFISENSKTYLNFFKTFMFVYFWHQICGQGPYLMRIDDTYLVSKRFKNINPDSVWSGPVRKLICSVRLSPNLKKFATD